MFPVVGFEKPGVETNRYRSGHRIWYVANLIERSKALEPFDLPLCAIHVGAGIWDDMSSPLRLATHVHRMMTADMDAPVIMSADGFIMDGWHRVARAIYEGRETIKAVRFDVTPQCDIEE